MKKVSFLLKNTVLITVVSLLMRSVALFFQTRVTGMIGAEGMGLLQLVMSVQAFAVTVASSGIRYSATRLLSEQFGLRGPGHARPVMKRCFAYALFCSMIAGAALFLFADVIGPAAGDERISPALRLLAPGLPFLSLTSVFGGYFSAVHKPWKVSVVQVAEQLSSIVSVFILLPLAGGRSIAYACAVIAACFSAADAVSFIISLSMYLWECRGLRAEPPPGAPITRRLLKTALPIAFSSYARTALSTLQHIIVPSSLRRSGASASSALSVYGTIHGMVFPVITFPQAFFYSLSELLIPELTEAQVSGDRAKTERIVGRVLSVSLLLSLLCAVFFFFFGPQLGAVLYKGQNAGEYIRVLAPLVIVMYLDSVTDGMLKGLGLQLGSMFINIADAVMCLVLVYTLLPIWAVKAYVGIIFFSECFNFALSFARLSRAVKIRLSIKLL